MEYLFSSPNMVLWHDSVGCRKEPDLFSKHCAHTLQKKKKIAMVVTYVFQTSGLKAKIYSVSSHVFWSEAWQSKTEIQTMRLLHGNVCLRQALAGPREEVLRLLSLCCMMNTHHFPPVSCLLPPPLSLENWNKTTTFPTQLEEIQCPDSCDRMEYF